MLQVVTLVACRECPFTLELLDPATWLDIDFVRKLFERTRSYGTRQFVLIVRLQCIWWEGLRVKSKCSMLC